jgi:hypothetical protein
VFLVLVAQQQPGRPAQPVLGTVNGQAAVGVVWFKDGVYTATVTDGRQATVDALAQPTSQAPERPKMVRPKP